MRKIAFLLIAAMLLGSNSLLRAQEGVEVETSGRQFYVEMGSLGGLFSANYQSRFSPSERLGWGYHAGLGFTLVDTYGYDYGYGSNYNDENNTVYTIPVGLNYIFGKANSPHTFEAGAGVTFLTKKIVYGANDGYNRADEGNVIGGFTFMYRRIPIKGGFTWGAGLSPIIGTSGDMGLGAAFNIGYSF
ncbi:MAG: hypothetical protein LBN93_08860 [Candidatus Symbiothrix sp.]|jgi:hypothetical protein|nr:hypothetical protein [Candidatus Symbiothrix sp.]